MADYLDRQAVIDAVYPIDPENDGSDGCTVVCNSLTLTSEDVESIVCAIPVANVKDDLRGTWLYRGFEKGWECSNCGSRCLLNYESDFYPSKFCPHCGAYMKGDPDEN